MPIEVHCPNPVCARVHLVKNRYAGMRGRCPACNSWMYVPKEITSMPSVIAPRPQALDDASNWQSPSLPKSESTQEKSSFPLADEPLPTKSTSRKSAKTKSVPRSESAAAAMLEGSGPSDESQEATTESTPTPAPKRFGILAAILLFLGMLGLGMISATPYLLESGKVRSTDELAKQVPSKQMPGFHPDMEVYVLGVPAGVAGVVLLVFLIGLITRRTGFLAMFLLYLTTIAAIGLAWVATHTFHEDAKARADIQKKIAALKDKGIKGTADIQEGQQLYGALGGAAVAAFCLTLAVILLHKGALIRFLAFVFLGICLILGPTWIYRTEIGLKEFIPPDVEQMIGF